MERIRFGDWELDATSGELSRGGEERTRLSPQPARLLAHLIRRQPQLVSREEVRRLLWPDVEVDFEQSLHTCVRQIRAALGDSATEPRYVETIPRRGYRFIGAVPSARGTRLGPVLGGLALAVLVLVVSFRLGAAPSTIPTRIGVMPFEPTTPTSALEPGNELAESIVRRLSTDDAEIVGPTTTASYVGGSLREMIAELDLDYLVNARETSTDGRERLLIEVIRARDGAHVWVRYLDELPAGSDVATIVAEATVKEAL